MRTVYESYTLQNIVHVFQKQYAHLSRRVSQWGDTTQRHQLRAQRKIRHLVPRTNHRCLSLLDGHCVDFLIEKSQRRQDHTERLKVIHNVMYWPIFFTKIFSCIDWLRTSLSKNILLNRMARFVRDYLDLAKTAALLLLLLIIDFSLINLISWLWIQFFFQKLACIT